MTPSELALKRPVTAAVASLLIVLMGLNALLNLPVRELPNVDTAEITVSVDYTGAAPDVVDAQITTLIEGAIAGIAGLDSITSEAERGSSRTVLVFDPSRDIDEAANDVRAAVDGVIEDLPDDAEAPEVEKNDNQSDPVLRLALMSQTMSPIELTDYADRFVVDRLARVSGVANVAIYGERAPAMRIWLDMRRMSAHGITVEDVTDALEGNNVELPAGELETAERQIQVLARTRFREAGEFEQLVLREEGARPVLLADVATIEPGAEDTDSMFRSDGRTSVGLGVQAQAQANTIAISNAVREEIDRIAETLPEGTSLSVSSDEAVFISASLREVVLVLAQSLGLVVAVIVVFLGSLRAAAVPVVTIPISLLGAVAGLYVAGFSVNLLTMFALILAIGLVVDDAIVVLENIQRRMGEGEGRATASRKGAGQVNFAVIATTLVLISVFVPISMMQGEVGRLFSEFGAVLAIAVAVSSFVALTLCPVLAARLLPRTRETGGFASRVDRALHGLNGGYRRLLRRALDAPVAVIAGAVFLGAAGAALYERLPGELTPAEDRGLFFVHLTAPQGSNLERTDRATREVEAVLEPYRESGVIEGTTTIVGRWGELRRAAVIARLAPWGERDIGQSELVAELRPKLESVGGASVRVQSPGGLGGGRGGLQVMLGGPDIASAALWAETLVERMEAWPGLTGVEMEYNPNQPGAVLDIDRDRARDLGLDAATIAGTVQVLVASRQVTEYSDRSRQYPVVLQSRDAGRDEIGDLSEIFMRTDGGELVPLSGFVSVREEASPPALNRFDRIPSVEIGADLAGGGDLGDAIAFVREAAEALPAGATLAFDGEAATYLETSGGTQTVFLMAILIVFLVLAAQFESFVHPFVILVTVPLALTGAFGTLWWTGNSLNVYSQVGLVLLVGLMAKNGVLIVEFINQLRAEGRPLREAVLEGAVLRLRPILMTTVSTVLGAVPLLLASGAGAASRVTIGLVICGGFAFASVLTLFVTPVVYEGLARPFEARRHATTGDDQTGDAGDATPATGTPAG